MKTEKSRKRERKQIKFFAAFLFLTFAFPANGQGKSPPEDEEFLPLSKTHLRGRLIDARDYETAGSSADQPQRPVIDFRSLLTGEFKRARNEGPPPSARSGNSFRETVGSVRIESRFEVLTSNVAVSDNYLRNVERTIRSNIHPPIIARTMQQTATVTIVFSVKKDGTVVNIEKETSTGSPALDATAISACRSSSPLPPLEATADEIIRMRFTLTYNPSSK
jgi:TonB family protein